MRTLADKHPEWASRWVQSRNGDVTPHDVTSTSRERFWFSCDLGHEFLKPVLTMVTGKSCPYYSHREVLVGFNDLDATHPQVAAQWHPTKNDLMPHQVMAGSARTAWWRCEAGHEWSSRIVARNTYGCRYCANVAIWAGYNYVVGGRRQHKFGYRLQRFKDDPGLQ